MQCLNYLLQMSQKRNISNFAIQEDFEMSLPFDLTSEEEMQSRERGKTMQIPFCIFFTWFQTAWWEGAKRPVFTLLTSKRGKLQTYFLKMSQPKAHLDITKHQCEISPERAKSESIFLLNLSYKQRFQGKNSSDHDPLQYIIMPRSLLHWGLWGKINTQ